MESLYCTAAWPFRGGNALTQANSYLERENCVQRRDNHGACRSLTRQDQLIQQTAEAGLSAIRTCMVDHRGLLSPQQSTLRSDSVCAPVHFHFVVCPCFLLGGLWSEERQPLDTTLLEESTLLSVCFHTDDREASSVKQNIQGSSVTGQAELLELRALGFPLSVPHRQLQTHCVNMGEVSVLGLADTLISLSTH
ncbi:hypothetical protein JZ751_009740 [Albula glossodonta]|uniref:Uncharacterized protein n=1 Tax=Albula glossodonta TaxID=121402 RepID=A0A8T2P0C9_9TELE|nr:hypothetical protein JZ751_009740 [Albula glossodonta]